MTVAGEMLKKYVERIERLEEEKKGLTEDIKEVYAEAKGEGFDVKVLRALISRRAKSPQEVELFESLLETYLSALGGEPSEQF